MQNESMMKAVVQKVIPRGNHGPFAVASSERIDGSITFSLEPTIWKEEEWPEEGTLVLLGKLRKKRAGWRAKTGRFFKPSDEQTERSNEMEDQYAKIAPDKINAAAERNPQEALLMVLANSTLDQARQQAAGEKAHEPVFHKSGWSIAIETPRGVVGLWSCWLDNQFYLGYPKNTSFLVAALSDETVVAAANKFRVEHLDKFLFPQNKEFDLEQSRRILTGFNEQELVSMLRFYGFAIPKYQDGAQVIDQLIMDTLGVELASPVLQVDATTVKPDYKGEYKDSDKPLVRNKDGQFIAYKTRGLRLWAKFYGPQVAGGKGRVWVDHNDRHSNSYHFSVVDDASAQGLRDVYYGHNYSRGVSTEQFSHYNEYAPDGPTADPEAIQSYRDKFLKLACEIAKLMGGAIAVNIDYGFVLVPEQLKQLGYGNITWLKGVAGIRKGWGDEIVRGEKGTANGKELLVLQSANSIVPWSNIRRVPCTAELNADTIKQLLVF